MLNSTSLAVEQSEFVNNTALLGAGIYMSRVTDTYIYDTYFYHNNATQAGGGIYSGVRWLLMRLLLAHMLLAFHCLTPISA